MEGAQIADQVEHLAGQAKDAAEEATNRWLSQVRSDPWTWLHALGAGISLLGLWVFKVIRPDGLTEGGGRKVDAHPTFIWLAAGGLAFLAMIAGGIVAQSTFGISTRAPNLRESAILSLANYAISVPTTLVLVRLLAMSAPESGLVVKPPDFTKGLLALLLAWPVVQSTAMLAAWITVKFGGPAPSEVAHSTLLTIQENGRNPWAWALASCAIIGAPIVEEFVFRGCLQSALVRLFGRPWPAIIATSAVFTVLHLGEAHAGTWHALAAIFVLGVGLGICFERTRSFVVPVVMHITFNLANILITLAKH